MNLCFELTIKQYSRLYHSEHDHNVQTIQIRHIYPLINYPGPKLHLQNHRIFH